MQTVHTEEKRFRCQECGKQYKSKQTVLAHQKTHEDESVCISFIILDCQNTRNFFQENSDETSESESSLTEGIDDLELSEEDDSDETDFESSVSSSLFANKY